MNTLLRSLYLCLATHADILYLYGLRLWKRFSLIIIILLILYILDVVLNALKLHYRHRSLLIITELDFKLKFKWTALKPKGVKFWNFSTRCNESKCAKLLESSRIKNIRAAWNFSLGILLRSHILKLMQCCCLFCIVCWHIIIFIYKRADNTQSPYRKLHLRYWHAYACCGLKSVGLYIKLGDWVEVTIHMVMNLSRGLSFGSSSMDDWSNVD